jgi:DNA invertase Pin-like site-specific DNA recombinase
MTVGYARVSTQEQNLSLQLDALQQANCEKIYQEKISACLSQRPVLEEMIGFLRKDDILIVWKLDRLGRSLKELIQLITKLSEKGVQFRSVHECIDTTSPVGKLTFHIFCALAEFERDVIRLRTLEGMEAARGRKKSLGRPSGLTKEAQQKAYIAAGLYKAGKLSVRQICQQLGLSIPTLYRYLEKENITLKLERPFSNQNT